jgi:prolyl 4-hydroxylase
MMPRSVSFHIAKSLLFLIYLPSFAAALSSQAAPTSSPSATRQLVTNWFSIVTHLQDPTLYSAEWASTCEYHPNDQSLVTSRDVRKFEILSLCAIHAVGLEETAEKNKDWIVFDAPKDGDYFFPSKTKKVSLYTKGFQKERDTKSLAPKQSPFRYYMTLERSRSPSELKDQLMFCDLNPTRPVQSGWMGHLAKKHSNTTDANSKDNNEGVNCFVIPISMPLCALVSNQDIPEGTPLVEVPTGDVPEKTDVTKAILQRYRHEIAELQQYMNMAYPKAESREVSSEAEDSGGEDNTLGSSTDRLRSSHPRSYYDFPRGDPKLQVLHDNPDIFSIPNFLTESECDRLIQKAQPHLIPCVTKNPKTGAVEQDPSRTSRNTNVPQAEVPTIVEKLAQLTNCQPEHLEVLQVLNYAPGQYFKPHTDGFTGLISACGFENSARLVTIFVYLNDVNEGGETRFSRLGLYVKPQKGMAVVHFPTSLNFEEDGRTEHQGMPAIDEKWLLVTWVWMHKRDSHSVYAEQYLDPLDAETI